MSFALPLALLALGLLAGPVIAHFVRRSDTRRHALPTVRLLARAVAESQRRRRIDDPWLFLLRALAVALAALAAASPFVRVPLELGDGRAAAIAFVLDGSRSMQARSGTTPAFERARERALTALAGVATGSEVTVVVASDPPRILADRALDARVAIEALESFDASLLQGGDSLPSAIRGGLRRLHGSSLAVRRMVVYSDFAAHVDAAAFSVPSSVAADFVSVGADAGPNGAVELITVQGGAEREGRTVVVRVRRFGPPARVRVRLEVEGDTVDTRDVTATPDGQLVELTAPRVRDARRARVSAEFDDALPEDDSVDLALRMPSETRVLLVDGEPSGDRFEDEVALTARALELSASADHRFEVLRTQPEGLGDRRVDDADVVVLANVGSVAPEAASALVRAVERGTGLLVAPGDRADGRSLTQLFGAILPARIGLHGACAERVGVRIRDAAPGLVVQGLDGTRFMDCTELDPKLGKSRVPLVRGDGSTLLVTGPYGRGEVAVLGSPLDAEGSDLPLEPGYLPLLAWLVRELDDVGDAVPTRVVAGATLPSPSEGATVVAPDGTRMTAHEGRLGPFQRLGVHRLERPQAASVPFTVVAPVSESDLRPGEPPSARRHARGGAGRSHLDRDVSAPFFSAFGVLLVAEGLLRGRQRGRRRASTTR